MKSIDLLSKEFISIDQSAHVSELIGKFLKSKEHSALVFDGNKLVGITDKHLLLRSKYDPSQLKVSKVTKKVHALDGSEDIIEAARLLFASDLHLLPVVQKSRVVGVVRAIDLIRLMKTDKEFRDMPISGVMSPKLISLSDNDTFSHAFKILREKKISRIPVTDKRGLLTGVLSLADIIGMFQLRFQGAGERRGRGALTKCGGQTIRAFRPDKDDIRNQPIANCSTHEAITASPDEKVGRVIDLMDKGNVSSIVLVDGDVPKGIVTVRDLLRLFLQGEVTI